MGKYLVAVDDGHGMETAGKRSPKLADGTVMKENEFNKSVIGKLKIILKRCNIDYIFGVEYVSEQKDSIGTYKVQVGAYESKLNAEKMRAKLEKAGFDAIIVE